MQLGMRFQILLATTPNVFFAEFVMTVEVLSRRILLVLKYVDSKEYNHISTYSNWFTFFAYNTTFALYLI